MPPIPGVTPWGRRILSHHGVGVKAFFIFPEILETKKGVRATEWRPLRVTAGNKGWAEEDESKWVRARGESRGRQVWTWGEMKGGGRQPQ